MLANSYNKLLFYARSKMDDFLDYPENHVRPPIDKVLVEIYSKLEEIERLEKR